MSIKKLRNQLFAAIAMVLVASIALGSSTYAWFVNNSKVTAESVTVSATVANTLMISETGQNDWNTILVRTDNKTTFVPVSTSGKTSTYNKVMKFAKDTDWAADSTDGNKAYVTGWEDAEANVDYYQTSFDIKASKACKVYLDNETVFNAATAAVGTTTNSMNKTLRLGLLVEQNGAIVKTYIYEVDATAISGAGNHYNTTIDSTTSDVNGIDKAVKVTEGISSNPNTFATEAISVDGAGVGALKLATPGTDGEFATNGGAAEELATLAADGVITIHAYIWMEGCDYDCNSAVVSQITGQSVTANLGFCAALN